MLILKSLPKNPDRFLKLIKFTGEILQISHKLDIEPVLTGSLAVFAYTQDKNIQVNDIDLSCKESDFPKIIKYLQNLCIDYKLKEWHVLQIIRDDLKVDFDSLEYWMSDMPENHEILDTGFFRIKMVCFDYLKQLYRRGLDDTAQTRDPISKMKHEIIRQKYEALERGH